MAVDLPGDDRSLNTRQKLLRFGQGQTQVRDIAKIFRPTDFYQIGAWAARVIPGRNQPQHPSHPRSPSQLPTGRPYPHVVIPPFSGHSPMQWQYSDFNGLTVFALYEVLRLRQSVL